jgi:alcohol oxidase
MPQPWYSNNRATGVAFALNPLFHQDGPSDERTVRGTRLVVLASGSFGTPGILERSGIGAKHVLDGVGVKQRVDLPGVGENYQGRMRDSSLVTEHLTYGWIRADHNIIFVPCFAADEAQTFDAIFRNDEGAVESGSSFKVLGRNSHGY